MSAIVKYYTDRYADPILPTTAPVVRSGPARVVDLLLTWQQRATERRHLGELDHRLLADVGISGADVEREAGKPFWRA